MVEDLLPAELVYFREVAEADSVSAAARRLRVNASAVSRQIAKLERSLGAQLFIRRRQGMELTAQGFRLLTHVRRARIEAQALRADLAQAAPGSRRLRVVCSGGFVGPVVAHAAASLRQRRPEARVEVAVASSDDVVRAVREARADIGACFVTGLTPGVRVEYALQVDMHAVAPAGHPVAERSGLTLGEALSHPYALLAGQSSQRDLLAEAARERGIALDPVFESDSSAALLDFVRAGGGLAFLSPLGPRLEDGMRFVRLGEAGLGRRSVQIHTPADSAPDRVRAEFLSLLVARLRSGEADTAH
ncbi:LysR family transcriptional regulator [Brevibacterium sp.]|uniref:LysR family transcriptional regulator n=1 Tax=Brevibacterium sp. TaxID=1701 RepID=UPI0025C0E5B8|nr:LysR family transcriptional regulator [Brevibacterium sp.]